MRAAVASVLTMLSLAPAALAAQDGGIAPPAEVERAANIAPHPARLATVRGADRRPWSVRVAESVMRRNPVVHERWDYTAGLVLTAIDRVGARTGDKRYHDYVRANIDRLVRADGAIQSYEMTEYNLDQIAEGRLLLALDARTHDSRYRKAADLLREQLRHQPRTSEGGFWHKQIYPSQMWLDGLYMAEPFYANYAAAYGDTAAFDDVARQFLLAARHMRDPRTGLLYHGWDESRSQSWADTATGRSRSFWGRAVGWYVMGLVDALDYLPATHPDRPALIRTLQDLADAVAKVQDPVTGLWYQVLDQGGRPGNYLEASGSSMFVYALAKGARKGYLDHRFAAVARRGHDGIVANLISVDARGLVSLRNICQVAGLGGKQQRSGTFEYYIGEPVVPDDYKGVGAFILASLEVNR